MKKIKVILSMLMAVIVAFGCMSVASAAIVDEQNDTNGTMETADVFTVADTAKGKINSSEDVDWYCFETTEDGLVTVTLAHTANASASTYFKVEIYNESAKAEASFSSKGDAATASSPSFGAVAGKHFVKVTKGDVVDTTLAYEISVAINTDALCELESNDTYDKATEITVTGFGSYDKYIGTIPSTGDVDYYKFEITKPGYVYFYIENDESVKGEYNVELQTWINGNDGVATSKTIGSFGVKKDDAVVQSPGVGVTEGDYYLAVSGTEGGYKVYVGFAESTKRESEYNDTISDADLIANGTTLWGSLFDKEDVDYFKFVVDRDNSNYKVSLAAYKDSVDAQWTITVYDASNNIVVDSVTASNTKAASIDVIDLNKGTYYIKVESGAIDSIELYQIGVEYTGEDESDKSFKDILSDIDWDSFLGNFSSWIGQIDFMAIISSIVASVIAIFARLG